MAAICLMQCCCFQAYYRQGVALQCLGRHADALGAFASALAQDDKSPQLLNSLTEAAMKSPLRGKYFSNTGFEPGRAIAPIPHCNWNCPLKNGQGDNLSPSKFREKTRKEAHMKRFISVQKLQAETERRKYILSHL